MSSLDQNPPPISSSNQSRTIKGHITHIQETGKQCEKNPYRKPGVKIVLQAMATAAMAFIKACSGNTQNEEHERARLTPPSVLPTNFGQASPSPSLSHSPFPLSAPSTPRPLAYSPARLHIKFAQYTFDRPLSNVSALTSFLASFPVYQMLLSRYRGRGISPK